MAMISCTIEDGVEGQLDVMLNLDHVLWMGAQPGQEGKTKVRLVNGETLWMINAFEAVGEAMAGATLAIAEPMAAELVVEAKPL